MYVPFMRKVDKSIGVPVLALQSLVRKRRDLPENPRRILIIKLFGFGNFIFLSPFLKSLRKMFPSSEIHVLTFRQNKEICEMYPTLIDKVHTINFSVRRMGFDIMNFVLHQMGNYDLEIDFEQFIRLSAIIGRMSWPRYFIGIATLESGKQKAYDQALVYPEKRHVVEEYYAVAEYLANYYGKKIDEKPSLVMPSLTKSKTAEALLKKTKGRIIIGVCPGGRADDPERKYPTESLAKALDMMARDIKRNNLRVVIAFFGTKSEKPDIDYILSQIENKDVIIDYSGAKLQDTAYLISKCKLFISNDTGPIHLAAALGVHCIGLYGPSKEWIYGPYTSHKTILRDKHHKPVRSNHNEKNIGWKKEWWPKPEVLYTTTLSLLRKQ